MARESRSQLPASRGATETICASVCMPARKSRFAKAASASLRNVATGLATCPDFGLDLGFQPDRAVGEVGSLEGLVGGKGGEREESDERGGKAGADGREHRRTSLTP